MITNRYQILSVLGSGGMATVYKALDKEKNVEVALKALNPDQLGEVHRIARFQDEFKILSSLSHENIVKVFELGQSEEGQPFFTMECLAAKALSEKLKEESIKDSPDWLNWRISILINIAETLSYLHKNNILYCDLKPANILILETSDQSVKIKLIDFGISKTKQDAQNPQSSKMIGTSHYMSPEQIRGDPIDEKADIYSFGVFAFELITGQVPFNHEALFSVTASHLIGKVPSIHDLKKETPKALDRMIHVCMAKEKEDRYSSIDEVLERLLAIEDSKREVGIFGKIKEVIWLWGGVIRKVIID